MLRMPTKRDRFTCGVLLEAGVDAAVELNDCKDELIELRGLTAMSKSSLDTPRPC
jgi:hypothetical protein